MNNEKSNLEILSKIVIQLKSEQKETIKQLKAEIEELKEINNTLVKTVKEEHDFEIKNLAIEIKDLKKNISDNEQKNKEVIQEIQTCLDKTDKELREDMLKLLKKYESKFQIQDDEIENLKEKCEINHCPNCDFESFKVHFKDCVVCKQSICPNCFKNCKKCDSIKCLNCLRECNNCLDLYCKSERCLQNCVLCHDNFCEKCNQFCKICNKNLCKKCLKECRICKNSICKECCEKCENCNQPILCKLCYPKNCDNEKCSCGKLLCFQCEDECTKCNIPFTWADNNRIFQGFHTRSLDFLPNKCIVKLNILHKGIDTSHLGLTIDSELKNEEKATENFWSLCLNTGEKFSTIEYKKKGTPWGSYAVPVSSNDIIYLKFNEGEVRFLINRKDYNKAFLLDKNYKYYLYCLTHNDSTKIEIRSMKIIGNNANY